MIPKLSLLGIILLSPVVLTQFDIKPDVSFTDNNERYDLTEMMMDKNMVAESPVLEDDGGNDEIEFRRTLQNQKKYAPQLEILKVNPDSVFQARKSNDAFAYDDKMDSAEGGTVSDFEDNLKHFQSAIKNHRRKNLNYPSNLRGLQEYRRNNGPDPESEILMHHAVPIVLQLDGYLKAPI